MTGTIQLTKQQIELGMANGKIAETADGLVLSTDAGQFRVIESPAPLGSLSGEASASFGHQQQLNTEPKDA